MLPLDLLRYGLRVDLIHPRLVFNARLPVDQLRVREGGDSCLHHEVGGDVPRLQGTLKVHREAIVAEDAQHGHPVCFERNQVVGDRPAAARCHFGRDHAEARDPRLARRLGQLRVVCAPAVETDVPHNQRRDLREPRQNLPGRHHSSVARSASCMLAQTARRRAGNVARWSPRK